MINEIVCMRIFGFYVYLFVENDINIGELFWNDDVFGLFVVFLFLNMSKEVRLGFIFMYICEVVVYVKLN